MSDDHTVQSFTAPRRRPTEIGRIPGMTLPWQFTLAQFGVGVIGLIVCILMIRIGVPILLVIPVLIGTLVLARAVRRVRIDDRPFLAGIFGWARFVVGKSAQNRLAPRVADVVVDNVLVGSDYSQWLVFSVTPAPYGALTDVDGKLASIRAVQQVVASVNSERFRLFSTVDPVSPERVLSKMASTSDSPLWERELEAEAERLAGIQLTDRSFWLMIYVGDVAPSQAQSGLLAKAASYVGFKPPARASWVNTEALGDRTKATISRSPSLRPAEDYEVVWLLDRSATGTAFRPKPVVEEDYPHLWRYPDPDANVVGRGPTEGATAWRAGDAIWSEPVQRIAVAKTEEDVIAHISAVVSQLPGAWRVPGGGELLWALDALGDPWEWLMDVEVVPHQIATAKTRNQHRRITNQFAEFEGDPAGAPPELDVAAAQIEAQREALAETRSDEYVATIVFTTAEEAYSDDPEDIKDAAETLLSRLERLAGVAASVEMTLVAPSGDQLAAKRLWLPRKQSKTPISRDYRQFLLNDGIAGLGPCLQSKIGDPQGALLGWADDLGTPVPVLFDPTLGPRGSIVGAESRSPSIGVSGVPGKGKSVFSKRVMWTTLMAGGAVVAVDRSELGEYVTYAQAIADNAEELHVEVVDVTDPASGSLDPMRTIADEKLAADTATLLLSYIGGIHPRTAAAARLASVASDHYGKPLVEIARIAADGDSRAAEDLIGVKELAEVLGRHSIGGTLFDPDRKAAKLDADLVVLWAPGLALSADPGTPGEVAASAVVLGTMLAGRSITFADTSRFAGMMLDEAWSLLKDDRARSVVVEGMRDGRKHNAAIWLASQSPQDFAEFHDVGELLGYTASFGLESEEAAVTSSLLAGIDPEIGAALLVGLPRGVALWRDVYGRAGLVEIALPADEGAAIAIDTTPTGAMLKPAAGGDRAKLKIR